MIARRILTLICAAFVLTEARWHQKREATSICDPAHNNHSKVLCYCTKEMQQTHHTMRSAECYLTDDTVKPTDHAWDAFDHLKTFTKITFNNARRVSLPYIPTHALKHLEALVLLDIKYGNIQNIHPYAFANLTSLEEINIRDSQVNILERHSFANLNDLTEIKLDKNNIFEINRDVFINLPSLEKLFLTSNQITTLHDKAFVHLDSLIELEINMNKLFSLNSDTFSGLRKLQKLDLSSNSLEVIGDNTFLPLKNLQSLNLEGNKIQMLDEKAFNGLGKLQYLSLAHNKLSNIENEKTFVGLKMLRTLSLRENNIRELKPEVMAPLLENFHQPESHLDVEDNNFPCDCRLEWFMTLMYETRCKNLKITLENLKCIPESKLREQWSNIEEADKTSGQVDDENQPDAEYEYYDDSQLNGKLFYADLKVLLNCNSNSGTVGQTTQTTPRSVTKSTKAAIPTIRTSIDPPTTPRTTTLQNKATTAMFLPRTRTIDNHGTLDLAVDEMTPKDLKEVENGIEEEKRLDAYTTTKLVTVSANPIENNVYENMASDEAQPDKLKAQRSVQEDFKHVSSHGHCTLGCASLIALISFRLLY